MIKQINLFNQVILRKPRVRHFDRKINKNLKILNLDLKRRIRTSFSKTLYSNFSKKTNNKFFKILGLNPPKIKNSHVGAQFSNNINFRSIISNKHKHTKHKFNKFNSFLKLQKFFKRSQTRLSNFFPIYKFKGRRKKKFFKRPKLVNLYRRFLKISYFNRNLIRNFFLKRNAKQHKISKFINKFSKLSSTYGFESISLNIYNILLNCRFFLFPKDSKNYIKKYGVYINGFLTKNPNKIINIGDVVQLVIVPTYFLFLKFSKKK